tara:strand:- start:563 stop:1183 length:621 start_codon:yes stop_codon:yes gene_type:complete
MPAYTKLKFRKEGQASEAEIDRRDLRKELEERENAHFERKGMKRTNFNDDLSPKKRRRKMLTNEPEAAVSVEKDDEENKKREDFDDSDDTASSSESEESGSDASESDDEEALLLELELQKIKKERAEAKKIHEEADAKRKEDEVLRGNPLLNAASRGSRSAVVARRWDDDVVFRNQARDEPALKKRFVNDTIRSDFHRRFMKKYIQ